MYSKNLPQRRPTGAKLRRLVAISVSSLLLLAVGAASAQTGRPGNFLRIGSVDHVIFPVEDLKASPCTGGCAFHCPCRVGK